MRVRLPQDEISILLRREKKLSALSACEDTSRRRLAARQEENPPQAPDLS